MNNAKKILEDVTFARHLGLMHNAMLERSSSHLKLRSGEVVVDFANCSYLGLDTDKRLLAGAKNLLDQFGIHFCCARSRLSIGPLEDLERQLSSLFGARAITFPSVTTTHMAVIPLFANGAIGPLRTQPLLQGLKFVFDHHAHASMQQLKPMLRATSEVTTIAHNDMQALIKEIEDCQTRNLGCIYFADGIYSMGGECPLDDLFNLLEIHKNFFVYLDDAHGTSIFGTQGEGFVASKIKQSQLRKWPQNLFVNFSLAKGFGCNGGGVLVQSPEDDKAIRALSTSYAFSGPLDFAVVGAALESIQIHLSSELQTLQNQLRKNVALFDSQTFPELSLSFCPIRLIEVGRLDRLMNVAQYILSQGFYLPAVFYPVVPKGRAALRVVLTARHSPSQISNLCSTIRKALAEFPSLQEEETHV